MLLQHFHLREQPFGVTSDPRYFYASPTHREALASLIYGIESQSGFSSLIAEPGLGKTTLLYALLERFARSNRTAFVYGIPCGQREFLREIFNDFDSGSKNDETYTLYRRFRDLVFAEARAGRQALIIIDEAQALTPPALEAVRLLSNFELPRAKVLHIVLAGQPQLGEMLARRDFKSLQQRITTAVRIRTLTAPEVVKYIECRLKAGGFNGGRPVFAADALSFIADTSGGVPREINRLCFNSLSLAFALNTHFVDRKIAEEAATDLELGSVVHAARAVASKEAAKGTKPQRTLNLVPKPPLSTSPPTKPPSAVTGANGHDLRGVNLRPPVSNLAVVRDVGKLSPPSVMLAKPLQSTVDVQKTSPAPMTVGTLSLQRPFAADKPSPPEAEKHSAEIKADSSEPTVESQNPRESDDIHSKTSESSPEPQNPSQAESKAELPSAPDVHADTPTQATNPPAAKLEDHSESGKFSHIPESVKERLRHVLPVERLSKEGVVLSGTVLMAAAIAISPTFLHVSAERDSSPAKDATPNETPSMTPVLTNNLHRPGPPHGKPKSTAKQSLRSSTQEVRRTASVSPEVGPSNASIASDANLPEADRDAESLSKDDRAPTTGTAPEKDAPSPSVPVVSGEDSVASQRLASVMWSSPVAHLSLPGSTITKATVLRSAPPQYPEHAKALGIAGRVTLRAHINRSGHVTAVDTVAGDPILAKAAKDAVLKWRYTPFRVDGRPVDGQTEVVVKFNLPR